MTPFTEGSTATQSAGLQLYHQQTCGLVQIAAARDGTFLAGLSRHRERCTTVQGMNVKIQV